MNLQAIRKISLTAAGVLMIAYSIWVLIYVQSFPDIGLRCSFSTVVNRVFPNFLRSEDGVLPTHLEGSTIVRVGDHPIETWPDLLRELLFLEDRREESIQRGAVPPTHRLVNGEHWVLVDLRRPGETTPIAVWCAVAKPPLVESVLPSVLWMTLVLGLLVVGAIVFWKRPTDRSASQFFLLCIVTLGAWMGGYHWLRIMTDPLLTYVFMICAVLFPAVSLHFFLLFPRPNRFLERHPRGTLALVYGVPLLFLVTLAVGNEQVRWLLRGAGGTAAIEATLARQAYTILIYLGVAAAWYLASIAALMHSYRIARDLQERNQVKWILIGTLLPLAPVAYTIYAVSVAADGFVGGAATWPMFAASACFTVAFTISITRYRLMELDKLIGSSMFYFLVSFIAGLVYYALVFIGMLVVGSRVIPGPSLGQALWVSSTALVLMLILDLARNRLRKVLDRRFSREKNQLDRTLQRLSRAIAQLVDPPTLARRLLHAAAELLGVTRGAVYLPEGDPPIYQLAGALGPAPPLAELAAGCPLVDALLRRGTLVIRAGDPLDPARTQLRFLGGELAHGLTHNGRLLALLILGPRATGGYSLKDLNLLAALAQMTALALENAEGHHTIETLNEELQTKVEKISEQQRRIFALQSQLLRQSQNGRTGSAPPLPSLPIPSSEDESQIPPDVIVGSSPVMRQLLQLVRKVSASTSAVLLRGESGTGKEMLAWALHAHSPRARRAFVKVHCAALSPGLLESELFGHVKGAFTGAHRDKVGRFELANGGTLFLDEIGDISLDVQTKLLRVLQEMTFERVGSCEPVRVDVRIIAATHQNLEELIHQGRFREDLYYRLNVISIEVPPLRDRSEDIPELVLHFLHHYAQKSGKGVAHVDDDAMMVLRGYHWPGNVRQLENVVERAVVVANAATVTVADLPAELLAAARVLPSENGGKFQLPLPRRSQSGDRRQREREELVRALAAAAGNKAEAARALGIPRSTLLSRLKKHRLS
ncbi:MAG: sigma 54-interacting transcriptional regulator [Gemmataceae bacterium]